MRHARVGRAFFAGFLCAGLACSSEHEGERPASPDPLRRDDSGHLVETGKRPARIVSLIPATTEILYAIGAGSTLVGRTDYCDFPPQAKRLPSVGSGIRPAVEPILSLQPDLVVIFAGPDNAASIERLRELGVPVFAVFHNTIAQLYLNIRRLGALTQRDDAAGALVQSIRSALDSLAAARVDAPEVTVYYDLWGDPPHTIGRGSYLSDLIRLGGGRNVFAELEAPSPRVNLEAILAARPELILVPSTDPTSEPMERLRARPGWAALPAVQEGRVASVDGDLVHRLGPRLPEAARAIADAIHEARLKEGAVRRGR